MASGGRPGDAAPSRQPVLPPTLGGGHPVREPPPRLYTAAEAAAILHVKTSWLERQAAARRIPFTMLSRSYRFTPAHIAVIVQIFEHTPNLDGDASRTSARRSSSRPTAGHADERPLRPRPGGRRHRGQGREPVA
jgi:hypothetical protein